jgi:8-oxo-dGTP pyrophosphatase MutT (NUDIX family)
VLSAALGSSPRNVVSLDGFKHAGVLVPIVHSSEGYDLLLTERTHLVETHKGQISFPGGMVDAGDADIVDTALRETMEEIGLEREAVDVIGLLDDLPTPTGFIITPVVGIIESLPSLTVNADEVAEVLHIPLSFFADGNNGRKELREFRGSSHEVWYYNTGTHNVWGATAMIIRSLLKKLGKA